MLLLTHRLHDGLSAAAGLGDVFCVNLASLPTNYCVGQWGAGVWFGCVIARHTYIIWRLLQWLLYMSRNSLADDGCVEASRVFSVLSHTQSLVCPYRLLDGNVVFVVVGSYQCRFRPGSSLHPSALSWAQRDVMFFLSLTYGCSQELNMEKIGIASCLLSSSVCVVCSV